MATNEKTYSVLVETRKRGAIGRYEVERVIVDAPDRASANAYARKVLQARGLEIRGSAVYENVETVETFE